MWRGARGSCAIGALVACLAGCTNEGALWEFDAVETLDDLAERFPQAERLLAQAGPVAIDDTPDGFRIAHKPVEPSLGLRWRTTAKELVVVVSRDDPASFEVSVPGTSIRVGVERSTPLQARASLMDRALRVHAPGADAEAFFFATDAGIEELLLVHDPLEPIRYELDIPDGWHLRRAQGSRPIVELTDRSGAVWLRVNLETAWDQSGERLVPELSVDQRSIRVALPEQAAAPVLLDPEWQYGGVLDTTHQDGTATLLPDGRVLITGGATPDRKGVTGAAEIYDPLTGTVAQTADLREPRRGHEAVLLRSGKVLITGGYAVTETNPLAAVRAAELYEPDVVTGTFSDAGSLLQGRTSHTATLLDDGQVHIAGGTAFGDPPRALVTAELYDPAAGAFRAAGALVGARTKHSATRLPLPGGQVLLVGGLRWEPSADPPGWEEHKLASAELYDPDGDEFVPTGALHERRSDHAAVLLSEQGPVLVAGGAGIGGASTATAELYDLQDGSFASTSNTMITARSGHALVLLPNGHALVIGGAGSTVVDEFDPGTSEFLVAEPLLEALSSPMATLLARGDILAIGDRRAMQLYNSAEPHLAQAEPAAMIGERVYPRAVPLPTGDALVVGGGVGAEIYDLETSSFRAPAESPLEDRYEAATATVLRDGRVLIAGGAEEQYYDPTAALASAELFYPETEQFERMGSMRSPRLFHTATLLPDGTVLVLGGKNGHDSSPAAELVESIEIFDPEDGTFAEAGSLEVPRWLHTATLLPDGRVLVAGGSTTGDWVAGTGAVELYDPTTEVSELLPSEMEFERAGLTATVLPNGKVLLTGGHQLNELFDPAKEEFEQSGSATSRFLPCTALLPSGRVLVAGGRPSADLWWGLNTTELYDPRTDTVTPSESMSAPRRGLGLALLPDETVLLAGGWSGSGVFEPTADLWKEAHVEDSFRPVVSSVAPVAESDPDTVIAGSEVVITGARLEGVSEAIGGNSPSPSNHPVVMWMPFGGVPTRGTTLEWTDTTLTWKVPVTSYPGPGWLFVAVNGVRSIGRFVTVLPAPEATPCEYDHQCESGHCYEPQCESGQCEKGVCCDQACDGCYSCLAEHTGGLNGQCGPAAAGKDPNEFCAAEAEETCKQPGFCDGAGQCEPFHADGTSCGFPGHPRECHQGDCLDVPCASNLDCLEGQTCMADGECRPAFMDDVPGCAPACAVGGKRQRGPYRNSLALLPLLGLAGLCAARRRVRRRRPAPRNQSARGLSGIEPRGRNMATGWGRLASAPSRSSSRSNP